ncbi:MAG TPA: alpha/beta hydrolase [Saprospiraceae bacterium]|nr:alpha/beta hydrolase [Saprospiraceae bacterium]
MKIIYLLHICIFLIIPVSIYSQNSISDYYTSFDKTKIHYEVWGEGKPILLIHGFTGTCNDWKNKPLADSLLANGYKLILVDLRGNGLSDQPDKPEAYANNAEAKDLVGLMQYLKIKKYDAVGYSRGSIILASLLVLDKHCKRAVLGGMGADFTNPDWPRRIGFYNALMNDTISGYEGFRKYIAGKGLNPLVLASQQKEQPSTSKEELAKLKQQVMIICGNEDTDNGKGSELQLLIPYSKFVEIKGNHNSSAYTVEFAEKILLFLKQ